jgi:hypothetical protein
VSQCKECTSEFCVEFRKERARRAHQRNHKLKGEASRLLNTLEEGLCREGNRGDIIVEDYVELCQVGIEQVQGVHKRNSVLSSVRREVSRRRHSQSY